MLAPSGWASLAIRTCVLSAGGRSVCSLPEMMGRRGALLQALNFYLCWVFVAECGLSLIVQSGSYSHLGRGFSLQWLLLWQSAGFVAHRLRGCSLWAPKYRLSSCSRRLSCRVACGVFLDRGLN